MPKILGDKRTKEIKIRLTDNEFAKLQQRRTKNLAGWLRDLACRNCGAVFELDKAPEKCPVCQHPQAYFEIQAKNW